MATTSPPVSKAAVIIGWIIGGLPALLIVFSGVMKLVHPPGMDEEFVRLGLPLHLATPLGIVELVCAALYLFPRTAVLGAILLTGYMGGTIITHLRLDEPFYHQSIIGVLFWLGLYLRDARLRELAPWRS